MGIYEELEVPRIINAMGTYTIYGGSRMSQETLQDIADAASSFVDIRQLQLQLSQHTAQLTKNESAYFCNGASSGIYLAILASIAEKKKKSIRYISKNDCVESEVIMFRSHRNPYDHALEQLGVKLVELGYSNHALVSPKDDILASITCHTTAIFYLESGWAAPGAPSLNEVIQAAHSRELPVILDAASMLPPVENLWNYTHQGVDLVIFSGGKDLCGPQASGLILGRTIYIKHLLNSAFPAHGYGRMFKIGREEMVGLYSALKQYLKMDHQARADDAENQVQLACNMLSSKSHFAPERSYPNEAGQPLPRVLVQLFDSKYSVLEIISYLQNSNPPIVVMQASHNSFFINPMSLCIEEMRRICNKLLEFEPNTKKEGLNHV